MGLTRDPDDLGYAGIGYIGDKTIYLTSGSFRWGSDKVFQVMAENSDNPQITRVAHSDGQASAEVQFAWDWDETHDDLMTLFVDRRNTYALKMWDGDLGKQYITNTVLTSFSLSGAGNALVNASATFMAFADPASYTLPSTIDKDDRLIAYWNTDSSTVTDIVDWSLSLTHEVIPKYRNHSTNNYPIGYRLGATEVELSINTYENIQSKVFPGSEPNYHHLVIGVGTLTIYGVVGPSTYTFGGVDAMGSFSYSFNSCQFMDMTGDHGSDDVDVPVLVFT